MRNIIKINGKTFEGEQLKNLERVTERAEKATIKSIPEYEYDVVSKEDTKSKLKSMFNSIKKNPYTVEKIYGLIVNKKNLEEIVDVFVTEYVIDYRINKPNAKYNNFDNYFESLKNTLYFSTEEIVKGIIKLYFKNIIRKMDFKELSKCELMLIEETMPSDFFDSLGISFSEAAIENGVKEYSEATFYNEIHSSYTTGSMHQCAYCPADIKDCPKLLDYRKKYIAGYEFINDGMQIADDRNVLQTFLVYDCDIKEEAEKKKIKTNKA